MITLDEGGMSRSSGDVRWNDEVGCLKMIESVFEIFSTSELLETQIRRSDRQFDIEDSKYK